MDNHAEYRSYVIGIFLIVVFGVFYSSFSFRNSPEGCFCCRDEFIVLVLCIIAWIFIGLNKIIVPCIIAWITEDSFKTLIFTYIFYVSSDFFLLSTYDFEDIFFNLVILYPVILWFSCILFWLHFTGELSYKEEQKQSKKKNKMFRGILVLSIFYIVTIFVISGPKEFYISSPSLSEIIIRSWNFLWQFKLQIGLTIYILDVTYNIWAYLEARKKGLKIPRIKTILLILGSFPLFINLIPPKK